MQIVNQTIHSNDFVCANMQSLYVYLSRSNKTFYLYLNSNNSSLGNGISLYVANLTLGFTDKRSEDFGFGFLNSSLENLQDGQGYIAVKNNLVASGLGSTQQAYKYNEGKDCYFRNISSLNYTILYDKVGNKCWEQAHSGLSYR